MTFAGKRVVLTGASGGIGREIAYALAQQGAQLLLLGRDVERLNELTAVLRRSGAVVASHSLNLCRSDAAEVVANKARQIMGGTDILINNAGAGHFQLFDATDTTQMEHLMSLNLLAPMLLARALLPEMLARGDGHIVNVGSTYGRLAFPGFAVYSATKHGLRGWSESLRRELLGTGVSVTYVSPRATDTAMNDGRAQALNNALGASVDEPHHAAEQILRAMSRRVAQVQFGWPEKLYTTLNALLPGLIDRALAAKLPVIRQHARPSTHS